jgi:outer membrane protein OmpU
MNKFKKIGLTALAGSLVATSVFAGELAVTGSATLEIAHVNGGAANAGKSFTMGNAVNLDGSGELDNGWTVAVNYELDQGSAEGDGPFDNNSLKLGMGDFGTLTFSGHGGSSASSAVDDTAGGYWDYKGTTTNPATGDTSDNMMSFNNSTIMDGLSATVSYVPHSATVLESSTDVALAYSGVDGLVVGIAKGENKGGAVATHAKVETWYANYTYGSVKVAYHTNEYTTVSVADTSDQAFSAYSISYTVSPEISVSYGSNTVESSAISTDLDQEVEAFTASYTTGGMGIAASMGTIDNAGFASGTTADESWWEVDLSFAF